MSCIHVEVKEQLAGVVDSKMELRLSGLVINTNTH